MKKTIRNVTMISLAGACKFDANGNPTECGVATISNRTGEIDVVAVQ